MTTNRNETQEQSVKQNCLEKLDAVIEGLTLCRNKIEAGEMLTNEDWLVATLPFNEIVEDLLNHKYLEE